MDKKQSQFNVNDPNEDGSIIGVKVMNRQGVIKTNSSDIEIELKSQSAFTNLDVPPISL